MPMKKSVWDLFHATFKKGDEVVIIDDDDEVIMGKMVEFDEDIASIRTDRNKPARNVYWIDVRFMSHDGFPVAKLMGADGSKLVEQLPTADAIKTIRATFNHDVCSDCGELFDNCGKLIPEETKCRKHRRHRTIGGFFGDPFRFEAADCRLWNPGNAGAHFWHGNPGEEFEECLEMTAKDGAKGHLFYLETVYHLELA